MGPIQRAPFIVGESADKVLGFLAGFFGNVVGFIATIVVMFIWAGSDPTPEVAERRAHATSVSIWSGIGCALPILLVIAIVVLGIVLLSAAATQGGNDVPPWIVPTQFPFQP